MTLPTPAQARQQLIARRRAACQHPPTTGKAPGLPLGHSTVPSGTRVWVTYSRRDARLASVLEDLGEYVHVLTEADESMPVTTELTIPRERVLRHHEDRRRLREA